MHVIDSYAVTFTVKDNNGNILSNLQVTPLSEDQIDQPGANTQAPSGTATATSLASSSATGSSTTTGATTGGVTSTASAAPTSSKGVAVAMRDAQSASMPLVMFSAILASFLVGFLV